MYQHQKDAILLHLTVARAALYRALEETEIAADYGGQDDVTQVNNELQRIIESYLPPRRPLSATQGFRTYL